MNEQGERREREKRERGERKTDKQNVSSVRSVINYRPQKKARKKSFSLLSPRVVFRR